MKFGDEHQAWSMGFDECPEGTDCRGATKASIVPGNDIHGDDGGMVKPASSAVREKV